MQARSRVLMDPTVQARRRLQDWTRRSTTRPTSGWRRSTRARSRRCSCAISRAPPRRWPAASGWWLAARSSAQGALVGPARGGVGARARRHSRGRQAAGGAARRRLAAAHAAGGAGALRWPAMRARLKRQAKGCRRWVSSHRGDALAWTSCRHAPSGRARRCARCARRPSLAPRWATERRDRSPARRPAPGAPAAPRRTSSSRR